MKLQQVKLFVLLISSFMLISYTRVILAQDSGSQEKGEQIAFLDLTVTDANPIILKNQHVTDAVAYLRFQYGCPVSIQVIEFTQQDRIPIQQGTLWMTKNRPVVNRTFSNLTVRQLLDELVEIDRGYHWKIYNSKHVVFEPRSAKYGGTEKSILDTRVSVSARDVVLTFLLSPAHPFGRELFYRHGLSFSQVVIGKNPELHKVRISIRLQNVSLRDALNAIVVESEVATGDRFDWAIMGRKIDGLDSNGKEVTTRTFTFHRFRQEVLHRLWSQE